MKAVIRERYGGPEGLQIADLEKPVPTRDQVLIRVRATSLNRSDWEGLTGKPLYARFAGVFRPRRKVLGSDVAGVVEAVGPDQREYKPGDEVFGETVGMGGGLAEYVCGSAATIARQPHALDWVHAAAVPQAGVIALRGIRGVGKVQPGQDVLINGAGRSAGSLAIQLAKAAGAEVTGVDTAEKFDFMRAAGAHHTVDYRREDFTKSGQRYDLILDLVAHRSVFAYNRALKENGRYYFVGGSAFLMLQLLLLGRLVGRRSGKRLSILFAQTRRQTIEEVARLCLAGELELHIDRTYQLGNAREALRALGAGEIKGKAVILVD